MTEIILLRINSSLKKELADLAFKAGVSASAIARNSILLAIMPPEPYSQMTEILMEMAKQERMNELWKDHIAPIEETMARIKNNGGKDHGHKE